MGLNLPPTARAYLIVVGAVAMLRLAELVISARNRRAMIREGAVPIPERNFGWMALLHCCSPEVCKPCKPCKCRPTMEVRTPLRSSSNHRATVSRFLASRSHLAPDITHIGPEPRRPHSSQGTPS